MSLMNHKKESQSKMSLNTEKKQDKQKTLEPNNWMKPLRMNLLRRS